MDIWKFFSTQQPLRLWEWLKEMCIYNIHYIIINKTCLAANLSLPLLRHPWTVACQATLSMEFPRGEYWSGLPFPSAGNLPNSGIKPASPALQADSLLLSHQGSPLWLCSTLKWRRYGPMGNAWIDLALRKWPFFLSHGISFSLCSHSLGTCSLKHPSVLG